MSKLNLVELRKKAAKLAKDNMVKIKEAAEIAKLQAMIKLESNESLLTAKAKLMVSGENSKKLQDMINECTAIINSMPVYNDKSRENRKWAGKHKYGFGSQVDAMFEIATGIIYSCKTHKDLLLIHTGLNLEMLSQLVDAFGNPTYYNRNNNVVVEEVPANIVELNTIMQVLQSEMQITIDCSKLTDKVFQVENIKAELRAHVENEEAQEAIEEADLEL
jgi:hypothetical protein